MMAAPWFKVYSQEFLSDPKVKMLDHDQIGKLVLLWAFANEDGCCIPSDPKAIGKLLGIQSQKQMDNHLVWIKQFFVPVEGDETRLQSVRLMKEQRAYREKCDKLKANGSMGGRPRKPNGYPDGLANGNQMPPEEGSRKKEKEKEYNPLPPSGSGDGVKQVRKPIWTKAHPAEVIQATKEIKAIWPRPEDDAFQPDGKTLVPGVSPSELASRLAEIQALGAELDVCVQIAGRVVSEWKAGKWIKAPQHFFGKAKDSPFRAYYQAHVTNEAVRLAS